MNENQHSAAIFKRVKTMQAQAFLYLIKTRTFPYEVMFQQWFNNPGNYQLHIVSGSTLTLAAK
jgi:hypothetical protein